VKLLESPLRYPSNSHWLTDDFIADLWPRFVFFWRGFFSAAKWFSCSHYRLCQAQEALLLLFHDFDHNTSTRVTLGASNVLAFLSLFSLQWDGVGVNITQSWLPVESRWLPHFYNYLDICQGLAPVLQVISFSCRHRQFHPLHVSAKDLKVSTVSPSACWFLLLNT